MPVPRYYDITVATHPELPVWPGGPSFQLWQSATMANGSVCNVSNLTMCVHTGTHIDAPLHFVDQAGTTAEIPLEQLIGPCHVVSLLGREQITAADLISLNIPPETKKLIFQTDNSRLWENPAHAFYENYCALTADAAEWLRDFGVHLIGIDYLSVSLYRDPPEIVHRILLEANIVLLEGLNLTDVPPGLYRVFCLPFKILNSDGSPSRVVLEEI